MKINFLLMALMYISSAGFILCVVILAKLWAFGHISYPKFFLPTLFFMISFIINYVIFKKRIKK